MVQGCGNNFCKYTFLFINLLICLAGLLAIALGIWAAVDKSNFLAVFSKIPLEQFGTQNVAGLLQNAAYILIAAGAVFALVSFLACCGAMKENTCLLKTYGALIIIFLILLIATVVLGFIFREEIRKSLKKSLIQMIQKEYDGKANSSNVASRFIDTMQVEFDCCGVNNNTDFNSAEKWKKDLAQTLPYSCCKLSDKSAYYNKLEYKFQNPACPTLMTDSNKDAGCYGAVETSLMTKIGAVVGIALAIVAIMIIAVVAAFCIVSAINSSGYMS